VGAEDEDSTTGVDAHQTTGVDLEAGRTTGVEAVDEVGRTTGVEAIDEPDRTTGVDAAVAADTADGQAQQALEQKMDEKYGPRTQHYNMRQRREPDYTHLFANTHAAEPLSTPQMNMRKGLKVFGEDGVAAVKKEMLQLHDRKVMEPRHAADLTPAQKQEALAYLMFLKRKRCGKIKGRGCADGRKQRAYTAREDAASPTVATESVFLTTMIDAMEGRDVAVIDVPGAFMQADMDELIHIRFTGKMVDLLMEIDPEMYGPCVVNEGKEKVMYVELLKALYGTIRAA
jgi:hypothetical protein